MSAAPGYEFPNPCTVCGSTDEHAEFRARSSGMGCTVCPHPAQPGHGTGCCCAGLSRPLFTYPLTELLSAPSPYSGPPSPSPPPSLTPDQVRHLLSKCVTVVKPGEVLILRAGEGWTPTQVQEVQKAAAEWLEDSAPGVKVMVVPPFEIAIVPGGVPGAA